MYNTSHYIVLHCNALRAPTMHCTAMYNTSHYIIYINILIHPITLYYPAVWYDTLQWVAEELRPHNPLHDIVWYTLYNISHCIVLHCNALPTPTMHCAAWHCIIHCIALYYTVMHCLPPQCTELHCISHYITLLCIVWYIALHAPTMHCIALYKGKKCVSSGHLCEKIWPCTA